jgi:DNA-binding CsgD family transcriptional regulator
VFSILISDIHLLAQKDPLWQYYFLRDTFIFVFFLAFIGLLLSQVYAYILNCVYCISVIIIWHTSDESFVNDNAIFLLLMMTGYAFATGLFSKKLKSSFKKNNELNSLLVQKDKEILEKENERVVEQVRLLKEMIEIKNKELMSRAMLLAEQIESNTRSAKKLDELEKYIDPKKITELKSIARNIRSENNLHWKEFQVRFKDVHQNFYANLGKEYTNLTPTEIKLAAFIKLKLSSKQIAILTNNTQGSIEVARSRLRKKLGIHTSHNLIDFLEKF